MGTQKRLPVSVSAGIRIPWVVGECPLCKASLDSASKAALHFRKVHRPRKLSFVCATCANVYPRYGQALAHSPKCGRPRTLELTAKPYGCAHCATSFSTKAGLTNHRRVKHAGAFAKERSKNKKVSRGLWTEEETSYLRDLITTRGNTSGLYKEAETHLKRFSRSQIREKGRSLKRALARASAADSSGTGTSFDYNSLSTPLPRPPAVVELKTLLETCLGNTTREGSIAPKTSSLRVINSYIRRMVSSLGPRKWRRGATRARRGSRSGRGPTAVGRRACSNTQLRLERDRKDAAKSILDGFENIECSIDKGTVHAYYKRIWETEVNYQGLGQFAPLPMIDKTPLLCPIAASEVLVSLRAMKRTGAPGPDRITRANLLRWDPKGVKLADLFNAIVFCGKVPHRLKASRTTLIPKGNDPSKLKDIGNWRPITIGSVVLRLLNGILNKRLSEACPVHTRQKGFIEAPGCAENLGLLDGLISTCRRERKPINVVFVDFAKAFDTVAHEHLWEVLSRRGVDEHLLGLIRNSYRNCHTTIKTAFGATGKIWLRNGVKQGDPLSPLLFNMAIDPFLYTLDRLGSGLTAGGCDIKSMAFADDLVLLSDTWGGMCNNLALLDKFCQMTGLRVNPKKCHGFSISCNRRGQRQVNECAAWKIDGSEIHMMGADESERYLGVRLNPMKGILKPPLADMVRGITDKITAARVKPSQKVMLLQSFGIPRLMYCADHGKAGRVQLTECDRGIRTSVKRWLHLHPSTADGLLYSRCADGGLGLVKLASQVPLIQLRRTLRLRKSDDAVTREVVRSETSATSIGRLLSLATGGGSNPSSVPTEAELQAMSPEALTSARWRRVEHERWCSLRPQGLGCEVFKNDRVSNDWLSNREKSPLKESEFILALKLRTNTPLAQPGSEGASGSRVPMCRLCDDSPESLAHIIGSCKFLKRNRMANHNKICRILRDEGHANGWQVWCEKRLVLPGGKSLVPDLLLVKKRTALVVDVTIRFERAGDTLRNAAQEKEDKYRVLAATIKHLFPGISDVVVRGFPLGARGKWHKGNEETLGLMGVGKARQKRLARLLSRRALLGTIDLCKLFRSLARNG